MSLKADKAVYEELDEFFGNFFRYTRQQDLSGRERDMRKDLKQRLVKYRLRIRKGKYSLCTKHQLSHGQKYPSCRIKSPTTPKED